MLDRFRSNSDAKLDALIDDVMHRMSEAEDDPTEYEKHLVHLERLKKVKTENRQPRLSRDTMVMCLTNLAGVIVIVAYEHAHVVTSKALGQLQRTNIPR